MSNQQHWEVESRTRALKILTGVISILGNTTPANGTFAVESGEGVTGVTRQSAGVYRLALAQPYVALHGANMTLEAATAVDLVPQIKGHDVANATAPYIDISLNTGATPTDTANGVTQKIHYELRLKNSSVR